MSQTYHRIEAWTEIIDDCPWSSNTILLNRCWKKKLKFKFTVNPPLQKIKIFYECFGHTQTIFQGSRRNGSKHKKSVTLTILPWLPGFLTSVIALVTFWTPLQTAKMVRSFENWGRKVRKSSGRVQRKGSTFSTWSWLPRLHGFFCLSFYLALTNKKTNKKNSLAGTNFKKNCRDTLIEKKCPDQVSKASGVLS